jgi:hypothetical protein
LYLRDRIMKQTAIVLLATLILGSCRHEPYTSDSSTSGVVDDLLRAITPPPSKGREILERFATTLKHGAPGKASTISKGPAATGRKALQKAYIHGAAEVGGLRRSQGEAILHDLLAENSTACAGASCARVFDVKPADVDEFLDDAYHTVMTSRSLAESNRSLWTVLISSLKKEDKFPILPAEQVSKAIARIKREAPSHWPAMRIRPNPILSEEEIAKRLSDDELSALKEYTYAGFDQVRLFENSSREALLDAGWTGKKIDTIAKKSSLISSAIAKLPPITWSVYRGIRKVEAEDVARLVMLWEQKKPMGLGPSNKPAVTSTSWNPEVAQLFLRWQWNPAKDDRYGIIFSIGGNHGGVAIEHISHLPRQREILIPQSTRFVIERIAPVEGEERMLVVTLKAQEKPKN